MMRDKMLSLTAFFGFGLGVLVDNAASGQAPGVAPETQSPARLLSPANPFGASFNHRISLEKRLAMAKELGLAYYRSTAQIVGDQDHYDDDPEAINWAGFKIALNVRNFDSVPDSARRTGFSSRPESFPTNLNAWAKGVAAAIDRCHPAVIVVGNEASLPDKFSGTPQQYETMLRTACAVAREKRVPCASDGMLSGAAVLYVFQHLVEQGQGEKAKEFREQAFQAWQKPFTRENIRERVDRNIRAFVRAYSNAQPDYVNIHWYVADPRALRTAVEVFRAATGRPVIINETNPRSDDPEKTVALMKAEVDLGIPYVIWYSNDAGAAKPRALNNPDGSWRPAGEAFKGFIKAHFP
jgi:hypothetical protein